MARRPRKKLTKLERARRALERAEKEDLEAKRELERADRQARRQLRREREAKKKRELQPYVIDGAHGDPLAVFREGLALARRAGMPWEQAVEPARVVALSVESSKSEREQFAAALDATRSAWRSAYEREPVGCSL